MRSKTLGKMALALTGLLVLHGCSRDNPSSQEGVDRGKLSGAQGRGSSVLGLEKLFSKSVTLPEGTPLVVRTTSTLSSKMQQAGHSFTAHLEEPLVLDGREIVSKGAVVEGLVVGSDKGGRVKGRATLAVQMTKLHVAGGQVVEISTGTIARESRGTKSEDALKIGIGSGVGAAIGAIAGGGRGAAIGAATGAGAGTGVVLVTHGDSAVIPSETVLHFVLGNLVNIAVSR